MSLYPIKILKAEIHNLKTFLDHYKEKPNEEGLAKDEADKWSKHIANVRKDLWSVQKALAILQDARKRKVN